LSGSADVRIVVPAWGAEFSGALDLSVKSYARMPLQQMRGPGTGRTFDLQYRTSY